MRSVFLAGAFLVGLFTLGGQGAWAQQDQTKPSKFQWTSTDLGFTYTTEISKTTPGNNNFWMQGGSLDAGITFLHGFGLAGNLSVDHAAHIAPGVNIRTTNYLAGPRYTFHTKTRHEIRIFAEALAGGIHASDSIFPNRTGLGDKDSSFGYMAGGGVDLGITRHLSIRLIEADYLRSYLANNGTNTQDNLRFAAGVSYHFKSE